MSDETVAAFMARMWTQDKTTISDADYSTLMAIALMGSQRMIEIGGPDVHVPDRR
jgi:hypothetical protein